MIDKELQLLEECAQNKTPVTAWRLCGCWDWVDDYWAYTLSGRARYELATATRNQRVIMGGLRNNLRQVYRSVPHDMLFVLVRKNDANRKETT